MKEKINRRNFLKKATIFGAGLLIGFKLDSPKIVTAKNVTEIDPQLYIKISPNDIVTFKVPNIELGQGTHTGQAMIIAEELELDLKKVNVINAPPDPKYGRLYTGGSASIKKNFKKLLQIGASTREMLLKAAANEWNVELSECRAKNGEVIHLKSNRKLTYGRLADSASKILPSSNPKLKNKDQYHLIGKSIAKVDISGKVNGAATFGMDVRIPEMLYAVVKQSPIRGGILSKYNHKEALKINGVKAVVNIPSQKVGLNEFHEAIAVVAKNNWQAIKGMEALNPRFIGGNTLELDSLKIDKIFNDEIDKIAYPENISENNFEVEYNIPFYAHATLEPLNFTVNYTDEFCEVWGPTQSQTDLEFYVKKITGFSSDKIKINIPDIGGSFGIKQAWDALVQSITISKIIKKPIQLMWTRDQDIQNSYPMQINKNRVRIGLNINGYPLQWDHKIVNSHSFAHRDEKFQKWLKEWRWEPNTYDGFPPVYKIENFSLGNQFVDIGIPSYNFRTTGCTQNCFVIESVIDEAAHRAKIDPLEYRLNLLKNNPRHYNLLKIFAAESKWDNEIKRGIGKGIAINEFMIKYTSKPRDNLGEATSIVAMIAEVSISDKGRLKIEKIDCKIDCGLCINPDIVKSQTEGGIMMGISMLLNEKITFNKGMVVQSNYDDYKIAKMKNVPEINISIIRSNLPPAGIAEAVVAPVMPAITNAIFAATGKRIRKLPIGRQKLV